MDIYRFIKFGIVGFVGIAVDFFITWLCIEKFSLNKYFASAVGFCFAVTNNYFLNKYFTFHNTDNNVPVQFLKFLTIACIGLVLSTTLLYFLQKYTQLHFYVCKLIVIAIVFFWNYTANTFYTFS